jgi:hypothetical protein
VVDKDKTKIVGLLAKDTLQDFAADNPKWLELKKEEQKPLVNNEEPKQNVEPPKILYSILVKNIAKNTNETVENETVEDSLRVYFGPFGNLLSVNVVPTEGKDTYEATIIFDSEESVKTAVAVNGSKFNGNDLLVEAGPVSNGIEGVNQENPNIFMSLFQTFNNKLDEIDNRLHLTKNFEETQKTIKGKVEEIDNKFQISKTIQEIPTTVSEAFNKTKEDVGTHLKIFTTETIPTIGQKISETTSTIGETVKGAIKNMSGEENPKPETPKN